MNIPRLRDFTSARVGLGRSGSSLPTREHLELQLAHARARQAVHSELDLHSLGLEFTALLGEALFVRSKVPDRQTYLRRPDLGRQLSEASRGMLLQRKALWDVVFVVTDGLAAPAVQAHASGLMEAVLPSLLSSDWSIAPAVIAEQGRVAIGDDIGECLGALLSVVLIGERPGLSCSDSLGVYMSWNPHPGLTDAQRNCISNIRAEGLDYEIAAHKLSFLMNAARRTKLSGIHLKEDAKALS